LEKSVLEEEGVGYSYAHEKSGQIVQAVLAKQIDRCNALNIPECRQKIVRSVRNLGRPGAASCAISAVDCALWDLKARLLGVSLTNLFGVVRTSVPVYGSRGFTSYSDE
jgi:L-alanine-DL-glutamate epimerase-like enolase superfamily enzyme